MTWNQKHDVIYWTETSTVRSEVTHQHISDGYNKRGRCGRVSRVSNAKQRLNNGLQWMTKRYNR